MPWTGTMPDMNDTVGELAIADATLSDLLRDILDEAGGQNSGEVTTGQAADRLWLTRSS